MIWGGGRRKSRKKKFGGLSSGKDNLEGLPPGKNKFGKAFSRIYKGLHWEKINLQRPSPGKKFFSTFFALRKKNSSTFSIGFDKEKKISKPHPGNFFFERPL